MEFVTDPRIASDSVFRNRAPGLSGESPQAVTLSPPSSSSNVTSRRERGVSEVAMIREQISSMAMCRSVIWS
jgi:hypothetical protein